MKKIKNTTFVLVRNFKLSDESESELQKVINKSVRGLDRKFATKIALDIMDTTDEEIFCHAPSARNPNIHFIFLENRV